MTMAKVFWIKDYDRGDLFRTTIRTSRLLGQYIFCDIDWLKDVAYDFAGFINSDKKYKCEEAFYDCFYPNLIKDYKSKIKYLYNVEIKQQSKRKGLNNENRKYYKRSTIHQPRKYPS